MWIFKYRLCIVNHLSLITHLKTIKIPVVWLFSDNTWLRLPVSGQILLACICTHTKLTGGRSIKDNIRQDKVQLIDHVPYMGRLPSVTTINKCHLGHISWTSFSQLTHPLSSSMQSQAVSISDKTSYPMILWDIKAKRLAIKISTLLWNLAGLNAAEATVKLHSNHIF